MQQFFNVSPDNWKKKKDTLLLYLSHYYQYEIKYNEQDHRKLDYHIIKKIKEYEPLLGKRAQQNIIYSGKIIDVIKQDNLQTPKNVSRIIKSDNDIVALNHKEGTIYEYTRVNMRTMFGKGIGEGGTAGIIFSKRWCRINLETNTYIPLNEEQTQYLFDTFYSFKSEISEKELSVYADIDCGLLTHNETTDIFSENKLWYFLLAKDLFKAEYGYYPIKVPVYEFSAFTTK